LKRVDSETDPVWSSKVFSVSERTPVDAPFYVTDKARIDNQQLPLKPPKWIDFGIVEKEGNTWRCYWARATHSGS
jgi:hypothetical protein